MSTRSSIIYNNQKHIYYEGNGDTVDFIWHEKTFNTKYGEPYITIDELFIIVENFIGHTDCRERFDLLFKKHKEVWAKIEKIGEKK